MATIRAIYENGVFRPLDPVDFPEGTEVMCEARVASETLDSDMDEIYEVLDRRHSSGNTDTAARHNEHQP